MVIRGTYKNGVVELDEKISLAEGQRVSIELQELPAPEAEKTVWEELLKLSGVIKSGRADGSVDHDRYFGSAPQRGTPA
jgi:predicted DNA-binding antitoxin AbrB/MazE fold protein